MSQTLRYLNLILPLVDSLIAVMNYALASKSRLPLFKQVWPILVRILSNKPSQIKQIQSLTIENLILPHLQKVSQFCQQSSPSREMLEFLQIVLKEFKL